MTPADGTAQDVDLASLVSAYLRERLARDGEGLRDGVAEDGVVLLADLAGYSRICATLVDQDARSAEEIGRFLNGLARLMADCIADHGGSVLAFAGDAIVAVWAMPDAAGLRATTRQAVACGKALQRIVADQQDPVLQPVRLKVSVDAGPVWVADVGLGGAQRHLHAAGPILEGLSGLGALARPGEVAIPLPLRDRLGQAVGGTRNGAAWIVQDEAAPPRGRAPSRAAPAISRHVAPSTRALASTGDARWTAEFRTASVLFLAVEGFHAGLPQAAARLDGLLTGIGAAVEATGGVVNLAINDDKGLTILAAWGLATNAHEDDAARSVVSAIAALEHARGRGFRCHAGVATGQVFAGLIGSADYRHYTVVGDPVNRAAALSRMPSDGPLVDAPTAEASSARFVFDRSVEVALKGWRQSWVAHSDPREQVAEAREHHAFVGRRRELSTIAGLVDAPSGPAAPIVLIEADAGLGKTRLAGEARRMMDARGLHCEAGAADVLRRTSALHAWRAIFGRLLGAGPAGPRLAALAADDPALSARLPLLNPVLHEDLPDTPETAALDTATRGRLLVDTVADIAARLLDDAGAGWLAMEDAHWLDSMSWQVLAEVRRRRPGLAVLVVSRILDRATLPREAAAMLEAPELVRLRLGALTGEESAELAAAVLGVEDLPGALSRLIHRRAEGHPLYVKELALSLRDSGIVRTQGRHCTVRLGEDGIAAIRFPEGVEGVVADRISNLDPATQLTLKAASVAGRSFDLEQLAAIRPGSLAPPALAAQMQAVQQQNGLVEALDDGGTAFRFHHAIIQDTAYGLLVRDQKVDLHGAAARWLERRGGRDDMAPVIAFHWSQAEEHDRAMHWYDRAAEAAAAGNAPAETVEFTRRARAHGAGARRPPGTGQRGRWLFLEGNALMSLGYYRRGADTLRSAIGLLDGPLPATTAGAVLRSLREFARLKIGVRPGSIPAEGRDEALMVATALHSLSEITYQHGDITQTLAGALRALNLAEGAGGDSEILAKCLMGNAFVGLSAPWAIDPGRYRDRALEMCERLDDDMTWSWVLFIAGTFEMGLGNLPAAQGHLSRCPPICERIGEWKNWLSAMANYANALRVDGRVADSQSVDFRLLQVALDRGNIIGQVWSRTAIAKNHVYLGEFEALDACLERLDVLFANPANVTEGSTDNFMTLHLAHACAHVHAGREAGALASLAEVARLFDSMASPGIYGMEPVMMMCDMIEVLRLRGTDRAALAPVLRATVAYGSRLAGQYPGALAKLTYARGDAAALAGRPRRAARLWEAARRDAAARGLVLDEAQASLRLAHRAGHSEAAALRARAATILRDLDLARPPLWAAQEV
jgi:class 3 adenylate cyclase